MFKERYFKRKNLLLNNQDINSKNRLLFEEFLSKEEYILKRKEGLAEVDERSYKTLYFYIGRLERLNTWFNNVDFNLLEHKDIKKLIDDLEDGVIKTIKGDRISDRSLYYYMLKGKLFKIIKKHHIAEEILDEFNIKGRKDKNEVRFISEEDFKKIVDCCLNPTQKCLLWLCFDIGENIDFFLKSTKENYKKRFNEDTKEFEYVVNLQKDLLKRSRTARHEITNYQETVKWLDIVLKNLSPSKKHFANKYCQKRLQEIHSDDKLFKFGIDVGRRFLKTAAKKANVKNNLGQEVTWKDLRSSMACILVDKGLSSDEVNIRLGHKLSSRMIDKYYNEKSKNKTVTKKKVNDINLKELEEELRKQKEINQLQSNRFERLNSKVNELQTLNILLQQNPDFMNEFSMILEANKEQKEIMEYDKQHPNEKYEVVCRVD